jgi:hypothetical protein
MKPKELVKAWVETFNRADADALAAFYSEDAVNHQVAESSVEGRSAIHAMFAREFAAAEMVCIPENIFEDGDWAILEWRDPKGLARLRLLSRAGRQDPVPARLLGQAELPQASQPAAAARIERHRCR